MSTAPALFPRRLEFTIFMRPEPQGSAKAFVIAGRARITSDNKKLRPYRSELTAMARAEMGERSMPLFGKHEPVKITMEFHFQRPASAKKRSYPAVKPDIDKLQRSVLDSLTGVAYLDDCQVVSTVAHKRYDGLDQVHVLVEAA